MASSYFSPSSALWPNTAALIGIAPCLLGLNAILRPRSALALLKYPAPTTPEAQKLADFLMNFYGARDLGLGLPMLLAWYLDARTMLAGLVIAGAVVAGVDGWASKNYLGEGQWDHWAFSVVGVAIGGGMLGWFGN